MCSFLVTNKQIDNIEKINSILSKRGPDNTSIIKDGDITFIHNLLHVTGKKTVQPLKDKQNVFLFNGEAYNYKGLSDTEFVFDGILKKGINFCKEIEGEFAIVCKLDNEIYVATDTFGTKPIFISKENGYFGICSFHKPLEDLGFRKINKMRPNEIVELFSERADNTVNFNLDQNEDTYESWENAFLSAIDKRLTSHSLLCLSSGYDSGAISLATKIMDRKIKIYCIKTNENYDILKKRAEFLGDIEFIDLNDFTLSKHNNIIQEFCDNYSFNDYNYKKDKASLGLSVILDKAKKDGYKVCISGAGADEIFSDYGINGRSVFFKDEYCTLKGIFPKNLKTVFPWNNFFRGRQERYLYKEEMVASYYGVETRYPFLDTNCVQKFLNLNSVLKNKAYKAPLEFLFEKYKFPYEKNIKRGFNP